MLQMNQHDRKADHALSRLADDPSDLLYFDAGKQQRVLNPFTRSMDVRTLMESVRESGLVERDERDCICRYNEPSDNMFLILRGNVGVHVPPSGSEEVSCDHGHTGGNTP
jgi:hypothetical protein